MLVYISQHFLGKVRAFTRKLVRIGSSAPVSATPDPQRTRACPEAGK